MSDREAFLRAIIDSPDDDTPRLVYADWLEENAINAKCDRCKGSGEEPYITGGASGDICRACRGTGRVSNGDAERAEWVRTQVAYALLEKHAESAHGYPEGDLSTNCDECKKFRAASHEIDRLWQIGTAGGGFLELPSHWGIAYWKRGFVDRLDRVSFKDWMKSGPVIVREHPIRPHPDMIVGLGHWREYGGGDDRWCINRADLGPIWDHLCPGSHPEDVFVESHDQDGLRLRAASAMISWARSQRA